MLQVTTDSVSAGSFGAASALLKMKVGSVLQLPIVNQKLRIANWPLPRIISVVNQNHMLPPGYHSVTPYLIVANGTKFLEFTKLTFDAAEKEIHHRPNGLIQHGEIIIGDSIIMFAEGDEQYPATAVKLFMYVDNVDAIFEKALKAGGTATSLPEDKPYGDRTGGIKDSNGNEWWIATRLNK